MTITASPANGGLTVLQSRTILWASVKAFRANTRVRIAVVIATLLSWVVLFNHCALGGMNRSPSAHQCCGKSAPAQNDGNHDGGRVMECCKTIRATVADGHFAVQAPESPFPLPAEFSSASEILRGANIPLVPLATGPPDSGGFFTTVLLKHSLPALAPPIAA